MTTGVMAPDDTGPADPARAHPAWVTSSLLVLPAAVLVGALVLGPMVVTVGAGLLGDLGALVDALRDEIGPFVRTALWAVVVPAMVTAVGLVMAALARRRLDRRLVTWVLLAPLALSLVVTSVAFRLVYDPDPARGTATALAEAVGPGAPLWLGPPVWVNAALMSAFVWVWVGLAAVVFRGALDRVRQPTVDFVRMRGGGRAAIVRDVYLPLLRRPAAVVLALVALATVRAFDLIVAMAPGSTVDEASVLAIRVWQTGGDVPALGVLWLLLVLGVAGIAAVFHRTSPPVTPSPVGGPDPGELWSAGGSPEAGGPTVAGPDESGDGGDGDGGEGSDEVAGSTGGGERDAVVPPALQGPPGPGATDVPVPVSWGFARSGWLTAVAGRLRPVAAAVLVVVWVVPVVVLVGTSLHQPRAAAVRGWWAAEGVGLGSYTAALTELPLIRSYVLTLGLATVVTVVVLLLAVPAAHALAWLGPGWDTLVSAVLLVAAVVPVLAVLDPLTGVLSWLHIRGTVLGLVVVHSALGLPFAVLVLRNAFQGLGATAAHRVRVVTGASGRLATEVRVMWQLRRGISRSLAAVAVLQFVQVWNDFVVGLLFGGPDLVAGIGTTWVGEAVPLSVLIFGESRQFAVSSGSLAATSVLAAVLPVALVLATWRVVVEGLVPEVRS